MKKIKQQKYVTEEQKEIKKFLIVLLGLILIIVGIYFFTRAFVTKDLNNTSNDNFQSGSINYGVSIVGTMLNRSSDSYYVFAYKESAEKKADYQKYISDYRSQDKALPVYTIDLDNELNKKYVAGENDTKSTSYTNLDELKFGEFTVIKVHDGKVEKFLTKEKEIKKELHLEK